MRILFIGNSHTYVNSVPKLVKDLLKESNIDVSVTMIAHPGWYLKQHLENPEVKFNILYGDYDLVIIQEHAHPFEPVEYFVEAATKINDYVRESHTKLMLYSTWPRKAHLEDIEIMKKVHREIAHDLKAYLAPVDLAWEEAIKNGIYDSLYGPDGEHASLAGSTLAAKVLAEEIKKVLF